MSRWIPSNSGLNVATRSTEPEEVKRGAWQSDRIEGTKDHLFGFRSINLHSVIGCPGEYGYAE